AAVNHSSDRNGYGMVSSSVYETYARGDGIVVGGRGGGTRTGRARQRALPVDGPRAPGDAACRWLTADQRDRAPLRPRRAVAGDDAHTEEGGRPAAGSSAGAPQRH